MAAAVVAVALPFGIRIGRTIDAARFNMAVSTIIAICTISLLIRAF